ncbi:MAG: Lrp/AsnC family transcriptional regulator, partial [Halobacteriota archaeon]
MVGSVERVPVHGLRRPRGRARRRRWARTRHPGSSRLNSNTGGGPRIGWMSDLDDLDLEILELLIDDARRPYSDIADAVDVSGPTVSDLVDRLVDRGVIRRFTVD